MPLLSGGFFFVCLFVFLFVFFLDIGANTWTQVVVAEASPTPAPRRGHSAVIHGGRLFVFAGVGTSSVCLCLTFTHVCINIS